MRGLIAALVVCLFLAASFLSLAGCGVFSDGRYTKYDESGYAIGDATAVESVRTVEIFWVSGDVTIAVDSSATGVSFTEYAPSGTIQDDELILRYKVWDGKLRIHYAASRAEMSHSINKNLTISVPASRLDKITVNSVAGEVTMTSVSAVETDVDVVSGRVRLTAVDSNEIEVDSVSADVFLTLCSFSRAEIDTVSGNVDLLIDKSLGFRCTFDTVSGKLQNDIGAVKNGNDYVYGNRSVPIEVNTVSGNLTFALSPV